MRSALVRSAMLGFAAPRLDMTRYGNGGLRLAVLTFRIHLMDAEHLDVGL